MMKKQKMLRVIGGQDLANNFEKIAETLSMVAYHYPKPEENILSQGGEYDYPRTVEETTTKYKIDSTGTYIDTIVAGTSSGCTYKIKPKGEVQKIASATSTAIFGAGTYTHCMLVLIELPTRDYKKVSVTLGGGSPATLTDDDVIVGDDVCYYVFPLGLYDNSGTTTAAYGTYTITLNGNAVKNEFDVSEVTLKA